MPNVIGRVIARFTRAPIAGARVTTNTASTITDSYGNFTVLANPAISELRVDSPGFRSFSQNYRILPNGINIGEIQLDSNIIAQRQ